MVVAFRNTLSTPSPPLHEIKQEWLGGRGTARGDTVSVAHGTSEPELMALALSTSAGMATGIARSSWDAQACNHARCLTFSI